MRNPETSQRNTQSSPNEWVDLHGDALYRFALIRVRDHAVAEEIVQETFLAALRAQGTFAGQATERTWMTGILRNKIADHFRKQSRDRTTNDASEQDELTRVFFDKHGHWKNKVASWPRSTTESMSAGDFWRILDQCMAKLPDGVRNAFVLREMEGVKTEQICKILAITTTNLGARLYRARMSLRQCLERNWFLREVQKDEG